MSSYRIMALIGLLAICLTAFAVKPKLEINFQDKSTVKGVVNLSTTVVTNLTVISVTFYVDDDVRYVDQSTPYEYNWDTVAEKEGDHVLTVAVNTDDGLSEKFLYNIKIDNDISKGMDYFLGATSDLLHESKWDEAILSARCALKVQEGYVPALLLLARAQFGKGNIPDARLNLEQALFSEPKNIEAIELMTQVLLRDAFNAKSKDEEKDKFIKAVKSRQKQLDIQIEAAKTDKDPSRLFELEWMVGNYSLTWQPLKDLTLKNPKDTLNFNRLSYAYLCSGKVTDASRIANQMVKRGIDDEYTHSVLAVVGALEGDEAVADKEIQAAAKINGSNPVIKLAQAYLACQKHNWPSVIALTTSLINDNFTYPEVYYYQMVAYGEMGDWDRAREAFRSAVFQEPAMVELYIQRGYENLRDMHIEGYTDLIINAKSYFQIAVTTRENSADALIGQALTLATNNEIKEAVKYIDGALKLGSNRAWVYIASASILQKAKLPDRAEAVQKKAYSFDEEHVSGMIPYNLVPAFQYVRKWGRPPVMIRPLPASLTVGQ